MTTVPMSHLNGHPQIPQLPTKWADLARDGDPDSGAHPREIAFSILLAGARTGVPRADAIYSIQAGDLWRDAYLTRNEGTRRSECAGRSKLLRDWAKAERIVKATPSIDQAAVAATRVETIRGALNASQWPGRSGMRDQIVLNALLDVAEAASSVNPTVSIRTLAQMTPYKGIPTILRAIVSLEDAGWVRRDRSRSAIDQATMYRLKLPMQQPEDVSIPGTAPDPRGESLCAVPLVDRLLNDRDRQLAILTSPHALAIYRALATKLRPTWSAAVAAVSAGVSRASVYNWLPRLAALGLVERVSSGWRATVASDDDVAVLLAEHDIAGEEAARRRAHDGQRKQFGRWVASRREELVAVGSLAAEWWASRDVALRRASELASRRQVTVPRPRKPRGLFGPDLGLVSRRV